MRVLHLVPDVVHDPAQHFLGSTKDVRCRTQYFAARRIEAHEVAFRRVQGGLADALGPLDVTSYDAVFLETIPVDIASLRSMRPRLLLVRSQNAELPHRWDWARATDGIVPSMRYTWRGVRGLLRELSLSRSGMLLAISDWEAQRYYRRFCRSSHLDVVPFFLADPYVDLELARRVLPAGVTRCVFLGSSAPNPLIDKSAADFVQLVRGAHPPVATEFVMTGAPPAGLDIPAGTSTTGLLESPHDVLGRATHVVLPSALGRGFKTKILEAVLSRSRVLVHAQLHRRLPAEVQRWCDVLEPADPTSFDAFLALSPRDEDPVPLNDALRARADAALDRALGIAF